MGQGAQRAGGAWDGTEVWQFPSKRRPRRRAASTCFLTPLEALLNRSPSLLQPIWIYA